MVTIEKTTVSGYKINGVGQLFETYDEALKWATLRGIEDLMKPPFCGNGFVSFHEIPGFILKNARELVVLLRRYLGEIE